MHTILMVVHILVAFALIGIILIQHGRGADSGAAFGSGASATVFGARGSATFLSRTTAILAIVFFSNSLLLAYLATHTGSEQSLMDDVQQLDRVSDAPPAAATDAPPAADAPVEVPVPTTANAPAVEAGSSPTTPSTPPGDTASDAPPPAPN